jgi:hypothetical protein
VSRVWHQTELGGGGWGVGVGGGQTHGGVHGEHRESWDGGIEERLGRAGGGGEQLWGLRVLEHSPAPPKAL